MFSFLANISEQKRQRYLISLFFFILLITLIILGGLYRKPKAPSSFTPAAQYREVTIDFKILENPLFQMLRPFETISPLLIAPGRENPFLPF